MSLIPFGFYKNSNSTFIPSADAPSYGWSFWKRNPNYNGFCIQVKRTSDDATQNIGFGGDNFLDITSLTNFVGNSTGLVKIFYDQYGGINLDDNESPNDNRLMPRLIVSGVLKTFTNGVACIEFGTGPFPRTGLRGGSGVNMATQYNSTVYWAEQNSATQANCIASNYNTNTVIFRGDSTGTNSANVFWDYFSLTANVYINQALGIDGFQNEFTINSRDLYNLRSFNVSTQGARLFASRGGGYNTLGTGFKLGGQESTFYRGLCNEFLIYNNTTHSQSKVYEIQSILNKSHQFYNISSITNDLVLWYDAGNTSSYPGTGTTITDLSVGGRTGTLNNGVAYSSSDGGKFILDGVDDWINTSGTTVYPWNITGGDFSIEVWVKFSNANQRAWILGTRNASTNSEFFLVGGTPVSNGDVTASKKIGFMMSNHNNSRKYYLRTTDDVIDGNWKHIIATRNGRTIKIFVNGVEKAITSVFSSGSSDPIYVNTSITFRVGSFGGGGGLGTFDISIMRLYKCELTQEQVIRNFNLEKSRYGL
jgi:hypothetical protein